MAPVESSAVEMPSAKVMNRTFLSGSLMDESGFGLENVNRLFNTGSAIGLFFKDSLGEYQFSWLGCNNQYE